MADAEILVAKPFTKENLAALKTKLDALVAAPGAWSGLEFVTVRNLLAGEHFEGAFDGAAARLRTGNFSGGYRIELADADGRPAAAWFRPSQTGTEFRFGAFARTPEGARAVQKAFADLLGRAA